ncbi:MAG: Trp family transcriptional regulator [Candidatus Curtissbacteria bacterium]|nr:Trp family transcriptional regulator [Candidatus Curtissbacteria bacterium]
MTRVSHFKLQQKRLKAINDHLLYLISKLENSKEVENFLEEFLTREEKTMLAKRLVVIMMIEKGYTPSKIQSTLNVSYETVRTYTNQLNLKNSLFKKTIERLIKRQKAKEFWKKVDKILAPVDLAMRSGRDMKARAKLYSGDWT